MSGLPVDVCLQCEQSRAEVKANDTICGIEGGYEYKEIEAECPRHHWRDWSDKELDLSWILPERYGDYRRARLVDLQYAPCEDTRGGHLYPLEDDPEWGISVGQCVECGKRKEA